MQDPARLRTRDGYFQNSFRPMLYLEYIWVRSEKQSFLWTHSAKIYSTDLPNWPKNLGYRWQKEPSGVRSP